MIQEETIPLILENKNVIIKSPTGSGKTLAYTIPLIGKINNKQGLQVLVLVPTRELAEQVSKEIKKLAEPLGVKVGAFFGGRDLKGDLRTIRKKNQIIVATPGRLLQHINSKTIKVGEVKFLVFDESDQMFDNGFFGDCVYIKKRVSSEAQIVLSSATMTDDVVNFVEKQIVHFEFVEPEDSIPSGILQEKLFIEIKDKNSFVKKFLETNNFKRAIIFCNTKKKVEELSLFLLQNNFRAREIHSNLDQKERNRHLKFLKEGKEAVLVATDIASRGLHIEGIDLIINYDIPSKKEFYIHRIGRSGRNGSKGYALNLICKEDEDRFRDLEVSFELDVDDFDESSFDYWVNE